MKQTAAIETVNPVRCACSSRCSAGLDPAFFGGGLMGLGGARDVETKIFRSNSSGAIDAEIARLLLFRSHYEV